MRRQRSVIHGTEADRVFEQGLRGCAGLAACSGGLQQLGTDLFGHGTDRGLYDTSGETDPEGP